MKQAIGEVQRSKDAKKMAPALAPSMRAAEDFLTL